MMSEETNQDTSIIPNTGYIEQHDSSDAAVQEKDSEALSSLLMLSKANPDPSTKLNDNEIHAHMMDYQNRQASGVVASSSGGSSLVAGQQGAPVVKRPAVIPTTERSMRGESNQPLSKTVKMEDLRRFFHLPIVEVARQLGTCTTALKKICRRNKINKWPYRQIRSITKSIQSLEMASLNDTLNEDLRIQYREQIVTLQNAIDDVIRDPNKVVQLVNMGLTEDMVKTVDRQGNATVVAPGGVTGGLGGVGLRPATAVGGVGGIMNMMSWPKPSADVQQIMQAASRMTSPDSVLVLGGGGGSSSGPKIKQQGTKRKAQAETGLGSGGGDSDGTITFDPLTGQAIKRQYVEGGGFLGDEDFEGGGGGGGAGAGKDLSAMHHLGGMGGGGGGGLDGGKGGGGDDMSLSGDDPLSGGGPDAQDNLRSKAVDIGLTIVQCDLNPDAGKLQFSGPVQLAPLQRKKLRPNVNRKVVPLMEPDIGSNFGIEFIPQFIVDIVQATMVEKSLIEMHAAANLNNGNVNNGSAEQDAASTAAAAAAGLEQQQQPMDGRDSDVNESHRPYANIMDAIDSEELDRLINQQHAGLVHK